MRMRHLFLAGILFTARTISPALSPCDVIWLEAESFQTTGGWVNDPQFVDIMGSPYLLANGVGEPVSDAVTEAEISEGGIYRLWVRCKDWLPEYSPGRFQVFVNGKCSATVFGKSDDDRWKWVNGGEFSLGKGEVGIRLHDLTGWWSRCDAVVLSSRRDFRPSDDIYLLESQRIQYFDPYSNVDETEESDVVVVGGGLAGCAAAIAAARYGCSVALVQDRPVLGGNASVEIGVAPGGDESHEPLDPGETGIIEEFYGKPDRGFDHDWSAAIEKVVRMEANIDLYLNTRAINVVMKDRRTIRAVVALNTYSGKRILLPGKIFIDCTGDGWIGFWAGATFRKGRESRAEFNESLAPEKPDLKTMGNTLMVAKFSEGDTSPFVCPPWAYTQWRSPDDFEKSRLHFSLREVLTTAAKPGDELSRGFTYGAGVHGRRYAGGEQEMPGLRRMPVLPDHYKQFRKGRGYRPRTEDAGFFQWWVELGGVMDTIYDAEQIRDELFRINLGLWNYVKNYDPQFKAKNENRRLTWVNYIAGKRESRRLVGDYILTQWDYADNIIHDDNVAYGGWGIDIHHPLGFWKSGAMYYNVYRGKKVSIPFRCLYSQNISNLMMAGRDISVSHVALGGVRVMRTTCLMGQAVGTAATVCLEKNVTPRVAGRNYIKEIQQRLLKDGAYVMGQKNEDPNDLARRARVTASSQKIIVDPRSLVSEPGTTLTHELNVTRAVMFKPGQNHIDRIALFLRSGNEYSTPLRLTLRRARAFGDFSSTVDLATDTVLVPPESAGWVGFRLDCEVDPEKYYYVALPEARGVQWDLFPTLVENTCRAYGGPNWVVREECYQFTLTPDDLPVLTLPKIKLRAENVIDGFNRAVNGLPHSWGPDPGQSLPQWIELEFQKPEFFNTVHVTFQNIPLSCPDYSVEVAQVRMWKSVVDMQGNRNRRNVHRFSRARSDRIRLVLLSPALGSPDDSAQVCEIRVYDE